MACSLQPNHRNVPAYSYKNRGVEAGRETSREKCPICLSEFEEGDEVTGLPCAHIFHKSCLNQWLNESPSCPMCRKSVGSVSKDDYQGELNSDNENDSHMEGALFESFDELELPEREDLVTLQELLISLYESSGGTDSEHLTDLADSDDSEDSEGSDSESESRIRTDSSSDSTRSSGDTSPYSSTDDEDDSTDYSTSSSGSYVSSTSYFSTDSVSSDSYELTSDDSDDDYSGYSS